MVNDLEININTARMRSRCERSASQTPDEWVRYPTTMRMHVSCSEASYTYIVHYALGQTAGSCPGKGRRRRDGIRRNRARLDTLMHSHWPGIRPIWSPGSAASSLQWTQVSCILLSFVRNTRYRFTSFLLVMDWKIDRLSCS